MYCQHDGNNKLSNRRATQLITVLIFLTLAHHSFYELESMKELFLTSSSQPILTNINAVKKLFISNDRLSAEDSNKFMTYNILRHLPYNRSIDTYRCSTEDRVFNESSFGKPGIFDFHVQFHTNLNILYIGSSVANQFVRSFQEASMPVDRQVIRYSWNIHNEGTHVALTPDNGTISGIRINGVLNKAGKDKARQMPPKPGGGWLCQDVREMKRLVHSWRQVQSVVGGTVALTSPCEIFTGEDALSEYLPCCYEQDFDIVVHQIAVEWMGSPADEMITMKALEELVSLSNDDIGASTIIIQTIPISNNSESILDLVAVNKKIQQFVRDYYLQNNMRITNTESRKILVMDLYSFSVSMFLQNSIDIGLVERSFGEEVQLKLQQSYVEDVFAYLNNTLELSDVFNHTIPLKKYWNTGHLIRDVQNKVVHRKIGHACGDINCIKKTVITNEGLHWCITEVGGRLNAVLACLVKCSLMPNDTKLRRCESLCNKQYMSLEPIPWEQGEEFDINGTLLTGLKDY